MHYDAPALEFCFKSTHTCDQTTVSNTLTTDNNRSSNISSIVGGSSNAGSAALPITVTVDVPAPNDCGCIPGTPGCGGVHGCIPGTPGCGSSSCVPGSPGCKPDVPKVACTVRVKVKTKPAPVQPVASTDIHKPKPKKVVSKLPAIQGNKPTPPQT